jgi:hypothetical protein
VSAGICRWCSRPLLPGQPALCGVPCFRPAQWVGWFDAKRLWEKQNTAKEEVVMANGSRDYPNSGILFKNDSKREPRDRDYKGTADVTCAHCGSRFQLWLSAWIKEGRKGKFLGLSFKAKEPDSQSPTPREEDIAF